MIDELREELQAPQYAELLAAGRDNAAAELLNAQTIPARRLVSVKDALVPFLGNSGVTRALKFAKHNPASPWEMRALEETVETLLRAHEYIDLDGAEATQMIAAFEGAGILSAPQKTALLTLADTHISRAEQLWGDGVSVSSDQIAEARRGG